MTLFMLSRSGLPGTAGFIRKFRLVVAAVNADEIALVVILVLTSAISLFYYLRLPVAMYMRQAHREPSVLISSNELLVLTVCAASVLYFGFFAQADVLGVGVNALDMAGRAADFLN